MSTFKTISAEAFKGLDTSSGLVLDVRTLMEHGEKHLSCEHAHAPLDTLNPRDVMLRHGLDQASPVYLVCRSGKRAAMAAEKFLAAGYTNVNVVEGGITACESCGHKVEGQASQSAAKPSGMTNGPITLERQVRIAAGAIAAIGAFLALTVSSGFALIPLFVGCGLIFAGVSDRCGMALVLTKAPWNRSCAGTSCATTSKIGSCS